ncbi:hypothetical protein D3C72_1368360 [compost metagenome]
MTDTPAVDGRVILTCCSPFAVWTTAGRLAPAFGSATTCALAAYGSPIAHQAARVVAGRPKRAMRVNAGACVPRDPALRPLPRPLADS